MSSLFGQVWFWSLLAFLVGAVLTWVLLVRPAQQRVQQLERQPRNGRSAPAPSNGQAQPQQIPPRPAQPSPRAPQPPQPAWPGQERDPGNPEHHPRTQWLERDSLEEARRAQAERSQAERTQAERTQQVPEQWPDATTQRSGVAEQRAQPTHFGQRPDQQPQAPGQRPDVPDQRAFVPAEPPVPYGQEEDVQGYPEDDDRGYQGDEQDYAPEYEPDYAEDEFTGRVHPASYADAAPGRPDVEASPQAWRQQPPGVRDRLDDIDEQPELGDLADLDADSNAVDQRSAAAQRPGGLFEPSGPAEQDVAYDDGYEANGYAGAQPFEAGTGAVDAPDTAADDAEQDDAASPDTDPVTGLPKRRRGASNQIRGGFAPPRPIEPSIRPVARRTPQREDVSSGSLFEPSHGEQAGAVAHAGGYAQPGGHAQPGAHAEAADVPPGPFGPGSAMPLPGGGRPDPSFTVKASVTELRYCAEGSPQFANMTPEVWFATPGDAERVGFRPVS